MAKSNPPTTAARKGARQPSMVPSAKKSVSIAGIFKGAPNRITKPLAKQEKIVRKKAAKPVPHSLSLYFNDNIAQYEQEALNPIPARLDNVFNELSDALNNASLDHDEDDTIRKLQVLEASVEEAKLPLDEQDFTIKYIKDGQEIIQKTTLGHSINDFTHTFNQQKQKLDGLWADWARVQANIDKICATLLQSDETDSAADETSTAFDELEKQIEDAAKTSLNEVDDVVTYCAQKEKKFDDLWNQVFQAFDEDD